jgi:hypothetical protein
MQYQWSLPQIAALFWRSSPSFRQGLPEPNAQGSATLQFFHWLGNWLLLASFTLLGVTPAQADSAKLVNPDNNHAYQRVDTLATWDAAKTACAGLGAHLATVTSQTENDWISNNILDGKHPWLGGTDTTQEGTWSWITGEQWNYTNWNWGEPNGGNTDNCLHYYAPYVWNDAGCEGGTPYICEWDSPLTTGLVAHYPFNGNANDESGNNNNGTVNGATLTSDRFGRANSAYSFNAVDNYVSTNNIASFFPNLSLTLSVWFKANNSGIIVTETEDSTGCYGGWCADLIRILDSGMTTDYVEPLQHLNLGMVTFGTWHNVVLRYNENTAMLDGFIDGVLSTSSTTGNRNSPVSLGRNLYYLFGDLNSSWEYGYFGGSIDDIRIYNRALSAAEVLALYNEPPTTFTVTTSANPATGGTVTPNTAQTVNSGATTSFTVTAKTGYVKSNTVSGTCPQGTWNGNIWTTGAISANCTVIFNFTSTLPPTCTTAAASNITINSATLNSNVVSSNATATASFELGPTITYGTNVAATPSQIYSSTAVATSANATGLACKTTYHFRCQATNSLGTGYGADKSFTTLATCPPNAWIYPATPVVVVGKPLALDIHVNSNSNSVGAYDFTINFDPTKLIVDTAYQNAAAQCVQGVCPGNSALANYQDIMVNNDTGNIHVAGFDATGVASGNDLQLLVMHFIAKNVTGTTPVNLVTHELTNPLGNPLGGVAKGATVRISPGLCGDSDGNGKVNIVDALSISRYVVGYPPPPTINVNLADVNRSGTATIVDALHIARHAVGLVVTGTCTLGQPL